MKKISYCFTAGRNTAVIDTATTALQYNGISRTSRIRTKRDVQVTRLRAHCRCQPDLDVVIIIHRQTLRNAG